MTQLVSECVGVCLLILSVYSGMHMRSRGIKEKGHHGRTRVV